MHPPEVRKYLARKQSNYNLLAADVWYFGLLALQLIYNQTLQDAGKPFFASKKR